MLFLKLQNYSRINIMPIENCKDLRGDLEFLKKLMEECGEIFYSSITNKDTRRLKELRSSFIAIMDGIKKYTRQSLR